MDELEKIGKSLKDANNYYESSFNKLKSGRGNLISQVEKLKNISNIRVKKDLDSNLVEDAMQQN